MEGPVGDGPVEEDDVDEDVAVAQFMVLLEEQRRQFEREGRYLEADVAKNQLVQCKEFEETRRREAIESRQVAERLSIEEDHLVEFQRFNKSWDQRMSVFAIKAAELVQIMKERHAQEYSEFMEHLQSRPEQRPKYSRDLLNLRKIQDTLAKAKKYNEAQKVKMKADSLEAWEKEKLLTQREQKLGGIILKFTGKQAMEMQALEKRILTGADEQKRQRQMDLERLLHRYQNIKSELEAQQNLERIKEQKYIGMSPITSIISSGIARTTRAAVAKACSRAYEEYLQEEGEGYEDGEDGAEDPITTLDDLMTQVNLCEEKRTLVHGGSHEQYEEPQEENLNIDEDSQGIF